jgi:hypothetical protein
MIQIVNSNIVTAFDEKTVGSKVTDMQTFHFMLKKAIEQHDFTLDKTPGQAVLDLTNIVPMTVVRGCVSGGLGHKSDEPADYVVRTYRGMPHMFLRRTAAEPVEFLRVVVYTRDAYLNDPDVLAEPAEAKRIQDTDCTHVLVAVLAGAVESFVSPFRFVANLAGGNRDYEKMTKDELVVLAGRIKEFGETWATVAD